MRALEGAAASNGYFPGAAYLDTSTGVVALFVARASVCAGAGAGNVGTER